MSFEATLQEEHGYSPECGSAAMTDDSMFQIPINQE